MQSTRLSVTAVASDKVKHQKLNFYINGKVSNFERIENVQFSRVDEGSDFIYSLSENMECTIEQNQTVVSVEKELKRFQKKMPGFSAEEKKNGFVNCVKGTYDFIYGVTGENEIEFSKDKLFTGFIVTGGFMKAISTNYNSLYRIRDDKVDNIFPMIEKAAYAAKSSRTEEYSPSKGVMKEYESDDIKPGDIFLFATTNTNTRINEEIISQFHDSGDDSEETAWCVVNEAAKHNIEDNFIVITVAVEGISQHGFLENVEAIKDTDTREKTVPAAAAVPVAEEPAEIEKEENAKPGIFTAAASIFKPNKKNIADTIDTKEILVENSEEDMTAEPEKTNEEVIEEQHKKMIFPGTSGEYKKLNVKRPRFMKRRMNIYLKRFISIIIVLVLMAGIIWGMYSLLKLIFTDGEEPLEISPTPSIAASPTPVPTPEPTPSPEPTPAPTEEPPEQVYMEYEVKSGDTLSKISATFYDGENRVAEIVAYNGIDDPNSIRVGQILKLPILEGTTVPSEDDGE